MLIPKALRKAWQEYLFVTPWPVHNNVVEWAEHFSGISEWRGERGKMSEDTEICNHFMTQKINIFHKKMSYSLGEDRQLEYPFVRHALGQSLSGTGLKLFILEVQIISRRSYYGPILG